MSTGCSEQVEIELVRTPEQLNQAFEVRLKVFVEEQGVPRDEELDSYDGTARHFLARVGGEVVGTARLIEKGPVTAKIGRVAILPGARRQGAGKRLMAAVEDAAKESGQTEAILEAQLHAIPFYEALGYRAEGDVFLDCNIPHRLMRKVLSRAG